MTKLLSRTGDWFFRNSDPFEGCLTVVGWGGVLLKKNWESGWEGDQDHCQWLAIQDKELSVSNFIYHMEVIWIKWEISYKRVFLSASSLMAFLQPLLECWVQFQSLLFGKGDWTYLRERKWVQEKKLWEMIWFWFCFVYFSLFCFCF